MNEIVKVLAIDEDPEFTMLTKLHLDCRGRVDFLESEHNRCIYSIAEAFKPDLIFVDIAPDHSDGEVLLRNLESDDRISGTTIIQLIEKGSPTPGDSSGPIRKRKILEKPIDGDKLIRSVQSHLSEVGKRGK